MSLDNNVLQPSPANKRKVTFLSEEEVKMEIVSIIEYSKVTNCAAIIPTDENILVSEYSIVIPTAESLEDFIYGDIYEYFYDKINSSDSEHIKQLLLNFIVTSARASAKLYANAANGVAIKAPPRTTMLKL